MILWDCQKFWFGTGSKSKHFGSFWGVIWYACLLILVCNPIGPRTDQYRFQLPTILCRVTPDILWPMWECFRWIIIPPCFVAVAAVLCRATPRGCQHDHGELNPKASEIYWWDSFEAYYTPVLSNIPNSIKDRILSSHVLSGDVMIICSPERL